MTAIYTKQNSRKKKRSKDCNKLNIFLVAQFDVLSPPADGSLFPFPFNLTYIQFPNAIEFIIFSLLVAISFTFYNLPEINESYGFARWILYKRF